MNSAMLPRCWGLTRRTVTTIYYGVGSKCGAHSVVPSTPTPSPPAPSHSTSDDVTLELVQKLEKLSLVDVANAEGLRSLKHTIRMADRLQSVCVDGVEPLVSLVEHIACPLSPEKKDEGNRKEKLLSCSRDVIEDYFVLPPGNIDYVPDEKYYKQLLEIEKNTQEH